MTAGRLARLRVSPPVNRLRYHAYRDVLLAFPRRRQCNLCGWRGRRFLTFHHPDVLCPKCGSMVRHRLLAATIDAPETRGTVRIDDASVLHLSPEHCLRQFVEPRASEYVRGDYATEDCDIHVDITDMKDIPDGRFDVLIACDVLEHILDEAAALREIRRVLRPGGAAILTVPQVDADVATYEDLSILSRDARSAAYGQEDHVRLYGNDFPDRLQAAGFRVTAIDASRFDGALVDRHVLVAPVPNPPPFDFNWRRVFIARVTA